MKLSLYYVVELEENMLGDSAIYHSGPFKSFNEAWNYMLVVTSANKSIDLYVAENELEVML